MRREFLPDALSNSRVRRTVKALRRVGDGNGLLPRLLSASDHALQWAVAPLGRGDLYSRDTNERARAASREIACELPAWCVLERGVQGGLHLNMLAPAAGALILPRGSWRQQIEPGTEFTVLKYLSKPSDARACDHKDPRTGIRSRPDASEIRAAVAEYEQARAAARAQGKRLPRLAWTLNLPYLAPDEVPSMEVVFRISEVG